MLEVHRRRLAQEGMLTLNVRARPNARATKVLGILEDGSVKLDLHAAPEDGEANLELVRFLAQEFDVPRANVELVSGHRGRIKTLRLTSR
jgi:uncharacterized protein (TIGR00251 family)